MQTVVCKGSFGTGHVQVKKADDGKWVPARLNDLLCAGDVIRVQERGRAALMLGNEQTLRLDQNSLVTLSGYEKEKDLGA